MCCHHSFEWSPRNGSNVDNDVTSSNSIIIIIHHCIYNVARYYMDQCRHSPDSAGCILSNIHTIHAIEQDEDARIVWKVGVFKFNLKWEVKFKFLFHSKLNNNYKLFKVYNICYDRLANRI